MNRLVVPLTVTARNEANALGACLDSLLAAASFAETRSAVTFDLLVVLDDTVDASASVASSRGIRSLTSSGGKVEAQRAGLRARMAPSPFHIFSDADIVLERDTLAALCDAMLADERTEVAVPPKSPLLPRRSSPLAHAIHVYNARRGFSSGQRWFSGKLFAIRNWEVPRALEIAQRARRLPESRFYAFGAPLRVDDIYLSRRVVHLSGSEAVRETGGRVWFRAPETWLGMYRYYRRMRRELERVDMLFPELGARETRTPDRLLEAKPEERRAFQLFSLALGGCRVAYRLERFACERLGMSPGDPWPTVVETKSL